MRRSVVGVVAVVALVAAASLVWVEVRQEREFRRLIAEGDAALAEAQTFVAIEKFSGAVTLRPAAMLPYLKRGETYLRRGELTAALRDLRQATALDPTAPQPIELLADVNSEMGRYPRAAELYTRYLELDNRAARVWYKLAVAQFRNGLTARAIEPLLEAVALDDRLSEAHYLLGMTLRAGERHEEAVQALARAVELNGTFIAAREELADLYADLGRVRDSLEQWEAIAALEPDRAERQIGVGLRHAALGRFDAAILALGRAAERYPDHSSVYTALGRVWLEAAASRGDAVAVSKAIEALAPFANRSDASGETLSLYGRALLRSGDAAAAERVLQQAVGRLPVDARTFRDLAEAARRLGHAAIARDADRRYAALTGST